MPVTSSRPTGSTVLRTGRIGRQRLLTVRPLRHDDKTRRKEVRIMKIRTSVFAGLLFLSSLGVVNNALAEDDGIISKQEFTPGSYCHEKFPAIDQSTLGSDDPTLKSSTTGDVIDFYGSCDESPTGKDKVWEQKLDRLFLQNAQ
jgi:hypothetical protein